MLATATEDAPHLAFALAVKLAVQRLPIPVALTDSMQHDIQAIRNASDVPPAIDVEQWIVHRVESVDERLELLDSVAALEANATNAAYVYGLAIGLTLAVGGTR